LLLYSPLLLNASAKLLSIPVFLVGLYLVLTISGLTGLALTLLGGTGIFGLAMGLGLRAIFENYAASIFLSIKKPFRPSDWVKIGEFEGVVQQINSRSTLIMEFTGNHVLIPNTLVYKSIIINKSANPKMRCDFVVGIDYNDSIESAQAIILDFLAQTPVVLGDPEPWVLVDELASSTVNLRVYFWLNVREISVFKVSSYILLEVKKRLLANGFHFPDPQREIVFTNQLKLNQSVETEVKPQVDELAFNTPDLSTLKPEMAELNQQADESDLPDQGTDLLV
jgi:small conductance mechanosensitive channel